MIAELRVLQVAEIILLKVKEKPLKVVKNLLKVKEKPLKVVKNLLKVMEDLL
ncbi:hypothetical protein OJ967_27605 (plasmid) [Peribacillus frigoritolerans]|nr:hypothetical protein OJ967_27605 [Peribacillus frigoritolerans]